MSHFIADSKTSSVRCATQEADGRLQLGANHSQPLSLYFHSLDASLGRLHESIALSRRVIVLDPLNVQGHHYLGMRLAPNASHC